MNRPSITVARALVLGVVLCAARTAAAQPEPAPAKHEGAAMRGNLELHLGMGAEVLLPADGGPLGGGAFLDGRYGIRVGPTILAPGGRLGASILSSRFVYTAMPTFRITLPLGPVAPYAVGGVGLGGLSNPADTSLAVLGGGGLMIHFGELTAIGAELTYQRIIGTEYEVFAVGPSLHVGG